MEPFLFGKNAAAPLPTLLVSCRAPAATLPQCYPGSPDARDSLSSYVFASQGTLDIAEVRLTSICGPRVWRIFRALAIFYSGECGGDAAATFLSEVFGRDFAATFFLDT